MLHNITIIRKQSFSKWTVVVTEEYLLNNRTRQQLWKLCELQDLSNGFLNFLLITTIIFQGKASIYSYTICSRRTKLNEGWRYILTPCKPLGLLNIEKKYHNIVWNTIILMQRADSIIILHRLLALSGFRISYGQTSSCSGSGTDGTRLEK